MIRIEQIKISVKENITLQFLKEYVCKKFGLKPDQIVSIKILKRSIDARNKNNVCYCYSLALSLTKKELIKIDNKFVFELIEQKTEENITIKEHKKVVVVGSGPAGIFCALTLIKSGVKVLLLERGQELDKRVAAVESYLNGGAFNPCSNIQFGEGGAGTFSDGKLNTGINSPLVKNVLETFYKFGASEQILYDAKPHIGTDRLRYIVKNMRKEFISLGGQIEFEATFIDFNNKSETGELEIIYSKNGKNQSQVCDDLVLAIGYSARDTIRMLYKKGLSFKQKQFSVGYRIEHLQSDINYSQYKDFAKYLAPADYKLFEHLDNGRTVYTFCMCPGGQVVPANSEEGQIVTNGMSYSDRALKNANSALLVSTKLSDYNGDSELAGLDFQEKLEREAYKIGKGKFICTKLGDFLMDRPSKCVGKVAPSIVPCYTLGDVSKLLPKEYVDSIKEALPKLGKKLKGFDMSDAILTGIETRSSAPYIIARNENLQTSIDNIYAIGEGAGQAGGIVSSAVDGIKIANAIISKYLD